MKVRGEDANFNIMPESGYGIERQSDEDEYTLQKRVLRTVIHQFNIDGFLQLMRLV